MESVVNGLVVSGSQVIRVWQQAFQALGSADSGDDVFDQAFASDIREQLDRWLKDPDRKYDVVERADLDGPISREEVQLAIRNLKRGKACGLDGVVSEIIKFGGPQMEEAVWKLLQMMFVMERMPLDWTRGLIFPIHKDGDERLPDNYRGITLLSVVGKLYSSIITKRVSVWCEEEGCLSEEQGGFRPGRGTIDQVFIMSELLKDRKENKEETICCFLDIRKAYDTMFREGAWKRH